MLLPRMVLHRGPRGSLVPKSKLVERFELFAQGEWQSLLEASGECDRQAAVSRRRSRRRDLGQCTEAVRELATLPLRLGGLGLTSAVRIRGSAHWGSSADCLPMALLEQLNGEPDTPYRVSRATGWEPPSWNEVAAGARPEGLDQDQFEPWDPHRGWQHEAASRMESWWMHEFVFLRMEESARALVLSQGGAGAGLALKACPTCRLTRLEPPGPPLAPSPIAPPSVRAFLPWLLRV